LEREEITTTATAFIFRDASFLRNNHWGKQERGGWEGGGDLKPQKTFADWPNPTLHPSLPRKNNVKNKKKQVERKKDWPCAKLRMHRELSSFLFAARPI
jgi:hypothetical protein